MARYDYQCNSCGNTHEEIHGMMESPVVKCQSESCKGTCSKVILTAPATVVPPHMQATGSSKFKYYGVDPITGDGITEDTNVSDPPGIRVKKPKKDS